TIYLLLVSSIASVATPARAQEEESERAVELIDAVTDRVVLEFTPGKKTIKLAVPAGRYLLREKDAENGREISIEEGTTLMVLEYNVAFTGLAPSDAGDPHKQSIAEARTSPLRPPTYDGLTEYGGPVFGLLGGHTATRAFGVQAGELRGDASVWEGAARLGWAFPPLALSDLVQPMIVVLAEG